MTPYRTAAGYGEAEYEDKRSRFIGHIKPVTSENEAKAFIDEMRRTYADATHNVFAYVLREGNILRWSDDGEPGGTSGQPTLAVLQGAGLTDVCCVTTRYFGGTLLGSCATRPPEKPRCVSARAFSARSGRKNNLKNFSPKSRENRGQCRI